VRVVLIILLRGGNGGGNVKDDFQRDSEGLEDRGYLNVRFV